MQTQRYKSLKGVDPKVCTEIVSSVELMLTCDFLIIRFIITHFPRPHSPSQFRRNAKYAAQGTQKAVAAARAEAKKA